MLVRRESSCFNNLRWRVEIDKPIAFEYFISQLQENGYTEKTHPLFPKIVEMVHCLGHSIVFVSATNRIQIKLDLDSDEDTRIKSAHEIASQLNSQLSKYRG